MRKTGENNQKRCGEIRKRSSQNLGTKGSSKAASGPCWRENVEGDGEDQGKN